MKPLKPLLAIDLGTTKCVACVRLGESTVDIELDEKRQSMLPSVFVHDKSTGQNVVGELAATRFSKNKSYKGQVIRNVKRYMGRDPSVDAPGAKKTFRSGDREFTPLEIAAEYLRVLRDAAERQTPKLKMHEQAAGLDWDNWLDAVIVTVPAYFGEFDRKATISAARLAGFKETSIKLLNEPTAAALYLGVHKQLKSQLVLIVDLGGGTCDLTLLSTDGSGEAQGLREVDLFGDNRFGGLEWDLGIAEIVRRKSSLGQKVPHLLAGDLLPDYVEHLELFRQAEEAKKDFCQSGARFTDRAIELEAAPGGLPEVVRIVAADFEKLSAEHAKYCGELCDRLLERIDPSELEHGAQRKNGTLPKESDLGIAWKDVDAVMLVGGGGLVPHVRAELERRWGRPLAPQREAQMAIGRGAAIYGQLIAQDATPPNIGQPRCRCDTGIMTLPDPPFWDRFRSWFGIAPRNNGQAKKDSANFEPLIWRNSLLPNRENVVREWTLPNPSPAKIRLELCVKYYTRRAPQGIVGHLKRNSGVIKVPREKRNQGNEPLRVWMWYDELHVLRCIAKIGDGEPFEVHIEPWDLENPEEFRE